MSANNIDHDQMLRSAASNLGLHCLPRYQSSAFFQLMFYVHVTALIYCIFEEMILFMLELIKLQVYSFALFC